MKLLKNILFAIAGLLIVVKGDAQNKPNGATSPTFPGTFQVTMPSDYASGSVVNWQRTITPLTPITDTSQYDTLDIYDIRMVTKFEDGLGRPVQKVDYRPLSTGDLVKSYVYDSFGRQELNLLPYMTNTADMANFKKNAISGQADYYATKYPNDRDPYSFTQYDDSTLYRQTKEMHAGSSFVGSLVGATTTHFLNADTDNIRMWNFSNSSMPTGIPFTGQSWPRNSLFVTEIVTQANIKLRIYKDKEGKVVLIKKKEDYVNGNDQHKGWLCTYFVYDDLNRLRNIITPKAVDSIQNNGWTLTQTIMDGLCYSYSYDGRGRVIAKKLPGQKMQQFVYDDEDRLVLYQDGNLSDSNQYLFVKYDVMGRPIVKGRFLNSSSNLSRDQLATAMSDPTNTNSFIEFLQDNNTVSYDTSSVISDAIIYAIHYYDNYSHTPAGFNYNDAIVQNLPVGNHSVSEVKSNETEGMETGSYTRVINPGSGAANWETLISFYDTYGKLIQQEGTNFKGGKDTMSIRYNFSNLPMSVQLSHYNPQASGSITKVPYVKVVKTFDYDKSLHLVSIHQKVNDEPYFRQLDMKTYDGFGKLTTLTLGTAAEHQLYTYRIWGALESINKNFVNGTYANNFFGELLSYDYGFVNLSAPGLTSGMQWRMKGSQNIVRAYAYQYDGAGRLRNADYTQSDNNGAYVDTEENYSANNMTYDANGNILTMDQWGSTPGYFAPFKMDKLTYRYLNEGMSNQLQAIDDSVTQYYGLGEFFEQSGTSATDYGYDHDGNTVADSNKGINGIAYDFLNKPTHVNFSANRHIDFTYDAAGNLLSKAVTDSNGVTKTIDYLGNLEYDDNSLSFISHEDGRCRPITLIDTLHNNDTSIFYEYDFYVKDHMGNVRSLITEVKDSNWALPGPPINEATNFNFQPVIYNPSAGHGFSGTSFTMGMRSYLVTSEIQNAPVENMFAMNVDTTRDNKPGSTDPNDQKDALLNAANGSIIGPSMVLRVMDGDSIQISTAAFYNSDSVDLEPGATQTQVVGDLVQSLSGAGYYGTINQSEFTAQQTYQTFMQSNFITAMQQIDSRFPLDSTKPKAFLNYVLLDDNMHPVPGCSGRVQVVLGGKWQTLSVNQFSVSKSGYIYVFLSNTSNMNVRFDNLNVHHYKGALLAENNYYPYGLTVTSNALTNTPDENSLLTGKTLNRNEFANNTGLNWYDFSARQYDPQIGRWTSVDPISEFQNYQSPYHYSSDNPVMFNDPSGMEDQSMDETELYSQVDVWGGFAGDWDGGGTGNGGGWGSFSWFFGSGMFEDMSSYIDGGMLDDVTILGDDPDLSSMPNVLPEVVVTAAAPKRTEQFQGAPWEYQLQGLNRYALPFSMGPIITFPRKTETTVEHSTKIVSAGEDGSFFGKFEVSHVQGITKETGEGPLFSTTTYEDDNENPSQIGTGVGVGDASISVGKDTQTLGISSSVEASGFGLSQDISLNGLSLEGTHTDDKGAMNGYNVSYSPGWGILAAPIIIPALAIIP